VLIGQNNSGLDGCHISFLFSCRAHLLPREDDRSRQPWMNWATSSSLICGRGLYTLEVNLPEAVVIVVEKVTRRLTPRPGCLWHRGRPVIHAESPTWTVWTVTTRNSIWPCGPPCLSSRFC